MIADSQNQPIVYPKVSICMPIYNGQAYIAEAIKSIIDQTYENWELIISDQTPDDSCRKIVYSFDDSRIKYFTDHQKGIFTNLNNAIKLATADLIQIFCQDDIMFPDMVHAQVEMAMKYPQAGMLIANMTNLTADGKIFPLAKKLGNRFEIPERIKARDISKYFLIYGCFPGNRSPVMITRESYNTLGPFDQNYSHSGDLEYWIRFSEKFDVIFNIKNLLAVRIHNGQAGNFMSIKQPLIDRFLIYKNLYEQNKKQAKSSRKLLWYINQSIGVQHLYLIIKTSIFSSGREEVKPALKLLFVKPLYFVISLLLMVFTINGRYKIIKLNIKSFQGQ